MKMNIFMEQMRWSNGGMKDYGVFWFAHCLYPKGSLEFRQCCSLQVPRETVLGTGVGKKMKKQKKKRKKKNIDVSMTVRTKKKKKTCHCDGLRKGHCYSRCPSLTFLLACVWGKKQLNINNDIEVYLHTNMP